MAKSDPFVDKLHESLLADIYGLYDIDKTSIRVAKRPPNYVCCICGAEHEKGTLMIAFRGKRRGEAVSCSACTDRKACHGRLLARREKKRNSVSRAAQVRALKDTVRL